MAQLIIHDGKHIEGYLFSCRLSKPLLRRLGSGVWDTRDNVFLRHPRIGFLFPTMENSITLPLDD